MASYLRFREEHAHTCEKTITKMLSIKQAGQWFMRPFALPSPSPSLSCAFLLQFKPWNSAAGYRETRQHQSPMLRPVSLMAWWISTVIVWETQSCFSEASFSLHSQKKKNKKNNNQQPKNLNYTFLWGGILMGKIFAAPFYRSVSFTWRCGNNIPLTWFEINKCSIISSRKALKVHNTHVYVIDRLGE